MATALDELLGNESAEIAAGGQSLAVSHAPVEQLPAGLRAAAADDPGGPGDGQATAVEAGWAGKPTEPGGPLVSPDQIVAGSADRIVAGSRPSVDQIVTGCPRPCSRCGATYFWGDAYGRIHCGECGEPPAVAMIRSLWLLVVLPNAPAASSTPPDPARSDSDREAGAGASAGGNGRPGRPPAAGTQQEAARSESDAPAGPLVRYDFSRPIRTVLQELDVESGEPKKSLEKIIAEANGEKNNSGGGVFSVEKQAADGSADSPAVLEHWRSTADPADGHPVLLRLDPETNRTIPIGPPPGVPWRDWWDGDESRWERAKQIRERASEAGRAGKAGSVADRRRGRKKAAARPGRKQRKGFGGVFYLNKSKGK